MVNSQLSIILKLLIHRGRHVSSSGGSECIVASVYLNVSPLSLDASDADLGSLCHLLCKPLILLVLCKRMKSQSAQGH